MENRPPSGLSFFSNSSPGFTPIRNNACVFSQPFTPINRPQTSTPSSDGSSRKKRQTSETRRSLENPNFECSICGLGFTEKRNLLRHEGKTCAKKRLSLLSAETSNIDIQSSNASSRDKIQQLEKETRELKAKVDKLEKRKRHYALKLAKSQRDLEQATKEIGARQIKPYSQVSGTQSRQRQSQLHQCATNLAGNATDAGLLIWDTLLRKYGKVFIRKQLLKHTDVVQSFRATDKNKAGSLVNSRLNLLRTSNTIFRKGSKMSYRNFRDLRTNLRQTNDVRLPGVSLSTYEAALAFCRSGIAYLGKELHPITDIVPSNKLHKDETGFFRDLEPVAVHVATKLLRAASQPNPTIVLTWAGVECVFHIAAGMDGFPWGSKALTTLEMSFLEVGPRIHSPEMLHVLLAGTFKEDSEAVLGYCKLFWEQMTALTAPDRPPFLFSCNDQKFKFRFKFAGMAADQKGHATMVGQKSQSAIMFSPYIRVHQQDKQTLFGSVGPKGKGNWQAITFKQRLDWVAEIEEAEHNYEQQKKEPMPQSTRDKLLRDLNNPQKKFPPIGALSEQIVIDILHMGINTFTKFLEGLVFGLVKPLTDLLASPGVRCPDEPLQQVYPSWSYARLCETDEREREKGQIGVPIVRLIDFMAKKMKMCRVAKQLRGMWNNGQQNIMFRLQGHDVRMLCHFGPQLVQMFHQMFAQIHIEDCYVQTLIGLRERLDFLHYVALLLRKIMTIASRNELSGPMLDDLESLCRSYQNVKVAVSRSSKFGFHHQIDFTMAYVVPYHARIFAETYRGQGIGKLSMQGHEKLHQDVKTILKTTIPDVTKMWYQLFEYAEIMSNFLPVERNKVGCSYAPTKCTYTPAAAEKIKPLDIICEIENCPSCQEFTELNNAAKTGTISSNYGAR